MDTERIVVIGADAAGMSAAHQALRTAKAAGRAIEVVALERTQDTSYSACGIPYWLAGDVGKAEDLVARSAQKHRDMGVDLRTGMTATGVDLAARTVAYVDQADVTHSLGFDQLVIATGARPVVPDWAARPGRFAVRRGAAGEEPRGRRGLDVPVREAVRCARRDSGSRGDHGRRLPRGRDGRDGSSPGVLRHPADPDEGDGQPGSRHERPHRRGADRGRCRGRRERRGRGSVHRRRLGAERAHDR